MTPLQIRVLNLAADETHMPGVAIMYLANEGLMQQTRFLLGKKYARFVDKNTRLVATSAGRTALENFAAREERRARLAAEFQKGQSV